jgi:hypothetical protein
MPYIAQRNREQLDLPIAALVEHISSPGELAYCLTKLVISQLPPRDMWDYRTLSALRGVIQDVSDEFYRRAMVPYEESKRDVHGDVYDPW